MTKERVAGFDRWAFVHGGRTHDVYRAGAGPAVVVVPEMPGIHPGVVGSGRRLADAGYSVYLPSQFGRSGQPLRRRNAPVRPAGLCGPRIHDSGRPHQPCRHLAARSQWRWIRPSALTTPTLPGSRSTHRAGCAS